MRLTFGIMAVLTSVLGVAAHVQSLPPPGTGRISGHVATAYAELVADATVTLVRIPQGGVPGDVRSLQSDPKGGFAFERLPAGQYWLSATKKGYTSRQPNPRPNASATALPGATLAGVTPSSRFDTGPVIDLGDGSQAIDLSIVLHRSARIAGRIIAPDGSAAPDVQVLVAARHGDGRGPMLLETRTSSQWDGRYEITDLPPGDYMIGAQPGWKVVARSSTLAGNGAANAAGIGVTMQRVGSTTEFRWTWYPGVEESEPGNAVTLLEGVAAEGIDIWLTPAQRFNVSGRVFWPVGVGVEDITIDYGDPPGTRSGVWFLSDPGGLFTLTGIPTGPLVLLARANTDQGTLIGIASTDVAIDSVHDVQIVVDRPGSVEGRVTFDAGLASPPGPASITLVQKLFRPSALYPVPEAAIGDGGRFALRDLLGEYEFVVDKLPPGSSVKQVLRNGVALRANRIRVMGGEVVNGVEVVIGK